MTFAYLPCPPRQRLLARAVLAVWLVPFAGACTQVQQVTHPPAAAPRILPGPDELQQAVDAAYAAFKDKSGGKNADYIPYLAKVPGRMAIVAFAPPLDEAGNSWRGARAVAHIVRELGVNLCGTGR